ncbi:hypothetical protein [Actinotalea sp. K2]|uniref:hypothetical protein n=1 Tax=Actinotalea sp. K2 TaxID=2939438 RepID=UPI002018046E|nr:hypothetical protein [Actinotalea sp. K2]MCL3860160.1 hypothetical protein [Actinotalea sp. K2]
MLVAAALIPETALLVPGAAGAAEVLTDERDAALDAVRDLVAHGPDRVVVVAARSRRTSAEDVDPPDVDPRAVHPPESDLAVGEPRSDRLRPTLAAAGIDDAMLGWPAPASGPGAVVVQEVGAAVALLLLDRVGWDGPVQVATVAAEDAPALRELGARLVEDTSTTLLLVGSLSARRGPHAPLPQDDRARAFDASVLADLTDLGPEAVRRLVAVPTDLARDLAVSAWAPWQVLLGAVGASGLTEPLRAELRSLSAPYGATYAVLVWGAA